MVTMVVEDGTGLANANSYGSDAEAFAYHEARGNAGWAAPSSPSADAHLSALIRATSYIDGRYGTRFPGTRLNGRDQALQWPREDAVDEDGFEVEDDEVPAEVKRATFEAALRELASPGSLNPDVTMTDRVKREKVDVIEVEYSQSTSAEDSIPIINVIEDILATLIGSSGGSTQASFFKRT
jgi:hypothetical protein